MAHIIYSSSVTIVLLAFSSSLMAAPPATAPARSALTDKTKDRDTKKTTMIRRDYGEKGTLVVDMRETRNGPDGRDIEYTYRLLPRGGGEPVDLGSAGYSDLTPF